MVVSLHDVNQATSKSTRSLHYPADIGGKIGENPPSVGPAEAQFAFCNPGQATTDSNERNEGHQEHGFCHGRTGNCYCDAWQGYTRREGTCNCQSSLEHSRTRQVITAGAITRFNSTSAASGALLDGSDERDKDPESADATAMLLSVNIVAAQVPFIEEAKTTITAEMETMVLKGLSTLVCHLLSRANSNARQSLSRTKLCSRHLFKLPSI